MESEALAPKVKAIFQAVIRLIKEGADLNNLRPFHTYYDG